ncbi:MAG: sulfur carrier protein ThiS [Alphaproteobacteria bacterium]|jgi:sulfur carrier protein|uniref:sulfur carrier protein ThiS n=1 Tax=Rhizobium sp. 'Codium 1' TaxID=2940484 RepID=UPI001E481D5C|nr:sulfur carrier protein ThiS [Rhizobium sp. 'Codium 1']MBU2327541.1 sulfur carrier protein ThiS [Alphaproteobacteria bacterium]MCC8933170.1 sulfur carrier protein ThiS [Rhizobium sp. 'Codium 1']
MKLTVNGETQELDAGNLADLLAKLDYEGEWLATAVNGDLVHREERAAHPLKEGDRIEVLSPMQGG